MAFVIQGGRIGNENLRWVVENPSKKVGKPANDKRKRAGNREVGDANAGIAAEKEEEAKESTSGWGGVSFVPPLPGKTDIVNEGDAIECSKRINW